MPRVAFNTVFEVREDGSVVTIHPTRIGGIQVPQGYIITPGVVFNGIDITQYVGRELETTVDGEVTVVTGIY